MVHQLKFADKDLCDVVYSGEKTFELRVNDRDYKVGDLIRPIALDVDRNPIDHPLNTMVYEITFVSPPGWEGIEDNYCIFSMQPITMDKKGKGNPNDITIHLSDFNKVTVAVVQQGTQICSTCWLSVDADIKLWSILNWETIKGKRKQGYGKLAMWAAALNVYQRFGIPSNVLYLWDGNNYYIRHWIDRNFEVTNVYTPDERGANFEITPNSWFKYLGIYLNEEKYF